MNHRYYLEGLRVGGRWAKFLGDTQLVQFALADGLPSTPSLPVIEVCASQGILPKMDLGGLLQVLTPGPSCKLTEWEFREKGPGHWHFNKCPT